MSSNLKVLRVCEHCGGKFTAKTTVTRFCSKICNERSYKNSLRALKVERSEIETVSRKTQQNVVAFENREILNADQAAKFIGVSVKALYCMIRRGQIAAGNLGIRMIRIKREELIRFVDLPRTIVAPIVEGNAVIPAPNEPLTRANTYSVAEITAKFGVKRGVVYNLLRKHEIAVFRVHREVFLYKTAVESLLTPIVSNAGERNQNNYYSVQEAMAKYGVNRERIYTIIKSYKIPKVKKGREVFLSAAMVDMVLGKSRERVDGVSLTTDNCYTVSEIQNKFSVGDNWLWRLLKKNKIPKFIQGSNTYLYKKAIDELFERIEATRKLTELQGQLKQYYSLAELMEGLGKTEMQVYGWVSHWQIPKVKVGRNSFYLKTSVDEISNLKKGGGNV